MRGVSGKSRVLGVESFLAVAAKAPISEPEAKLPSKTRVLARARQRLRGALTKVILFVAGLKSFSIVTFAFSLISFVCCCRLLTD
jgi:hypothetical protein